jgi:predicted enzyme related to lactoylglutathione lyase
MPTRDHAPTGAPCWTDLWTSDVDRARAFYGELFGWTPLEPSEEFGGYFMFALGDKPTAGGMGDMGEMKADDTWKVYLQTDDAARTVKAAAAQGATVVGEPAAVAHLGTQAVLIDPTGAPVGMWQPGTFPGFIVTAEHGTPSWFELQTTDFATSTKFYESVFKWQLQSIGDADEFRYSVLQNPEAADEQLAGIMDASAFPGSPPAAWSVYWHVDDVDDTVAMATKLGGSVVQEPETTPYGRLATAADPMGAVFKLRTAPDGS